ncbi:MAG: guanine deaminase, partial [Rhodospirillaceae bacterium]
MATRIIKGQVVTFQDDPFALEDPTAAVLHHSDGAVWIVDGVIRSVGTWSDLKAELGPALDSTPVEDYGDHLIVPGFVDCHAHYPQLPIIASYGTQLLEWLQKYTFPMEVTYRDPEVSRAASAFYLDQCLANGITTACVYATVHPVSAEMFFQEAEKRNMRMASGKVLMDRNAPDGLRDTAETGYTDSEALIKRWHRKGRALYCLTPRFAATSTHEQLEAAKALRAAYPDILMQTHLSENHKEIAWIAELFPEAPDYFGVYERAGLAGPGSIFGHGI